MHKVAINLRQLMKAHGLSENALARHVEVPQPTVHRVLAGGVADPRDKTLRPLATWFGVSVEQLRTDLPEMEIPSKDGGLYRIRPAKAALMLRDREPDVAVIEVVGRVTTEGNRPAVELAATGRHHPYPADWFTQQNAAPVNVRVLSISGAAMTPTLFEGDQIAVNLADTRIHDGRVHLLISGGGEPELMVRRLFKTPDGKVRVVCDNPDASRYPDDLLDAEDLEKVVIVGRVIDRRGAGGL